MHRFRVWGPRAKRVSVVVDGEQYAMASEPRGWWVATVEKAHAGSRYGFPRAFRSAIGPILAGVQNPPLSKAEIMIGMLRAAVTTESGGGARNE